MNGDRTHNFGAIGTDCTGTCCHDIAEIIIVESGVKHQPNHLSMRNVIILNPFSTLC
jgi:hypothetical protein